MDKEQNKRVKFTLERAPRAQRGVEIHLYSFFNLSGGWRCHAPAALLLVPIVH